VVGVSYYLSTSSGRTGVTSEYLDAINYQRLGVDAIRLDDGKIVPID
jgi:hypothetical protein